jgi:hypothetical protein
MPAPLDRPISRALDLVPQSRRAPSITWRKGRQTSSSTAHQQKSNEMHLRLLVQIEYWCVALDGFDNDLAVRCGLFRRDRPVGSLNGTHMASSSGRSRSVLRLNLSLGGLPPRLASAPSPSAHAIDAKHDGLGDSRAHRVYLYHHQPESAVDDEPPSTWSKDQRRWVTIQASLSAPPTCRRSWLNGPDRLHRDSVVMENISPGFKEQPRLTLAVHPRRTLHGHHRRHQGRTGSELTLSPP